MFGNLIVGNHCGFKTPSRHINPRQSHNDAVGVAGGHGARQQGHKVVPASWVEERLVGGDSGRDNAGDFAAEQALGCFWVVDLFANRNAPRGRNEFHQMDIELVVRKSRHRHRIRPLLAAGEREIEQIGSFAGIVAEEFVKVAHAKKYEGPRTPGLGRLELLHHGGRHGGKM